MCSLHIARTILKRSSRLEKSLNLVKVLEKYLISLLGLEKSLLCLSYTVFFEIRLLAEEKLIGNVKTFLFIFYMLFLHHRCNCKLYSVTVAMQSVVMESSKK